MQLYEAHIGRALRAPSVLDIDCALLRSNQHSPNPFIVVIPRGTGAPNSTFVKKRNQLFEQSKKLFGDGCYKNGDAQFDDFIGKPKMTPFGFLALPSPPTLCDSELTHVIMVCQQKSVHQPTTNTNTQQQLKQHHNITTTTIYGFILFFLPKFSQWHSQI